MIASDDKAKRLNNINAKQQKIQALRKNIHGMGAQSNSERPPKVKSKSITGPTSFNQKIEFGACSFE